MAKSTPASADLAWRLRLRGLIPPLVEYENPRVLEVVDRIRSIEGELRELDIELARLAEEEANAKRSSENREHRDDS